MKVIVLLNTLFAGAVLLTVLACADGSNSHSSGEINQINIPAGSTETSVSGELENFQSEKVFTIAMEAEQTLSVNQIMSNDDLKYITLNISDPNGQDVSDMDASCNNRKVVPMTITGNYTIRVAECMKADPWAGVFTLKIMIE